ncbi:MAG: hypothetical protein D8B38_06625 [Candidatus Saccharimonas sp.]|nr:MAG: hypothetical protein D8B38_06625 [Candidatus Saccharimonas sp.]
MSLAVVSTEAAPVDSLLSTAEGGLQSPAGPVSRACQVGYLALVSESTALYKSSKELNAARIIDRERQQREQILHGVVGSLASIVAEMKSKAHSDQPPITITHSEITYAVHYFYERCLDCRDCGHGFDQDLLAQEQHGFIYGGEKPPSTSEAVSNVKELFALLAQLAQADTRTAFNNSYITQLPTDIEPLRRCERDDPIGTEYNQYGYRVGPREADNTTDIGTTQTDIPHQPTLSAA